MGPDLETGGFWREEVGREEVVVVERESLEREEQREEG